MNILITADYKQMLSTIPTLKVGDQVTVSDGSLALHRLKQHIASFNNDQGLLEGQWTSTGTITGNVMKKSPTTLTYPIRAMLLEDGSLSIFRPRPSALALTLAKRKTKLDYPGFNRLVKGEFRLADFDISNSKNVINSDFQNLSEPNLVIPSNAVELYNLEITQTFKDDVLTGGSVVGLYPINVGSLVKWKHSN